MRFLFFIVLAMLLSASAVFMPVQAQQSTPGGGSAAKSQHPKGYRLAAEASPYLRQHAGNPVEWYPWGEEAFEKARKENKPIFLSIGYSTCYWCHVMKRESFENADVANLLNDSVVAIKVDRERRPDVDATYMIATELIAQSGGWPNSVFLTPDLKPFFALTYAPAQQFSELIGRIAETWKNEEAALRADADRIAGLIGQITTRKQARVEITAEVLTRASLAMLSGFDVFHGGIGTAPKFPREQVLSFLYQRAARTGDQTTLKALGLTLDNMVRGGIHDHVGGGFHRYAVDNDWAVPHFEKMLYNQAMIGRLLVQAYEYTGRQHYRDAARKTLDFVITEMTTDDGGFASAFDAETDGKEGLYYLWSKADFDAALMSAADFGAAVFGVTEDGNHEGLNTLRLAAPIEELAVASGLDSAAFQVKLDGVLGKLRSARDKRPKLLRDDKVIADWNAAMIRTLAEASIAFSEKRYVEAAEKAMGLLIDKLGAGTAGMQRSYFENSTGLPATQADHAWVGLAALALYDVTNEKRWLELSATSAVLIIENFADPNAGDYYLTTSATGFVRTKQHDDGDLQGANGAALELFALLTRRDPDPRWRHAADQLGDALSGLAVRTPLAMAGTLVALEKHGLGDIGARQSMGKGAVRISTERDEQGASARVVLELAPGWHINSSAPTEDFLIPTKLTIHGREVEGISYPAAFERKLGFHEGPLQLYEGKVALKFPLANGRQPNQGGDPERAERVTLSLQACSDRLCLEPETAELIVPASPRH
ncbi:MAG: DUF255 domain-containing protein [Alphaproteobacteria bacterium]|nr:DUF255 domain-containing protein [Alphaproteobacteria bacterium]